MLVDDFVKRAIDQDKRNIFEASEVESFVPNELKEFYEKANPVNVEITMDGNAIRFFPMDELEDSQSDYDLGDKRFVFASCNGDPIYLYCGEIYTCNHGTKRIKDERIADSFGSFMDNIDSALNEQSPITQTDSSKTSSSFFSLLSQEGKKKRGLKG